MVRPKTNEEKKQINLTINKQILEAMREYSNEQKKSLSQITEELYQNCVKDSKLAKENPEELMRRIREAMPLVEKMINEKTKQQQEDSKKS